MAWQVDFYQESDGSAPVEVFLDGLPKQQRAKALALIKLLEEQGTCLPFPYSSQVRGRLRELRTRFGKTRWRSSENFHPVAWIRKSRGKAAGRGPPNGGTTHGGSPTSARKEEVNDGNPLESLL